MLFTTYNCSSRLVNDSKYLSCRALIRAAGVHQFRFDCTRPNFDCDCVFHSKTQPWTLFQGAYRAVFVTAGNNYLKTTRASFSSITVYNKDYVRTDSRQKHNSTENPEISVLLAYNMKLFTVKVKRTKKLQPENRRKKP